MFKPLIRTLDGWRFELPLALVLGAAAAFATIAMPYSPFATLPAVIAFGWEEPLQWILAAIAALVFSIAAYRAMKYPWPVSGRPVPPVEDEPDLPPIDVGVRLRRSDAHPDFPPREPIRASRDLGEPFMDIVGFADGPDAAAARWAPIPDADYVEVPAVAAEPIAEPIPGIATAEPDIAPAIEEQPVAGDQDGEPDVPEIHAPEPLASIVTPIIAQVEAPTPPVEPAAVAPVEDVPAGEIGDHSTIAAFTPEPAIAPLPRPERPRRESLAEMMDRLSAGLERRAGRPVAPPPADMLAEVLARPRGATPELRSALDELNRLAGRRG